MPKKKPRHKYKQVKSILESLGLVCHKVKIYHGESTEGMDAFIFRDPKHKRVLIFLPKMRANDLVDPIHIWIIGRELFKADIEFEPLLDYSVEGYPPW